MGRKKTSWSENIGHCASTQQLTAQRRLLQKSVKDDGNTGSKLHSQNLSSSSIVELFSENHFLIFRPVES